MIWTYAYTPTIWLSFLTVLLLITLVIYSGRRRNVPGASPFSISCLFAAAWAAGNMMEVMAQDPEGKIAWLKFQAVWQLPVIIAVTCFVLEYAWPGRWLSRRNLALMSIPALLALALILTNDLHHLIWRGFSYGEKVIPLRGLGNWIVVAYGYGLTIVNLIVFAWLFRHSPQHRWPVTIMATGQFLGRGLYLLQAATVIQLNLPLGVMAVTLENLMYAFALFGFRLFDPIPLARQTAIEQLQSGMLVLDPQGMIVSLNPAAEGIFHLPAKCLIGQPARELLPTYLEGYADGAEETTIELSIEDGQTVRYYVLETSALNDWRGLAVGRLLLLHDVTEQKRVQAKIVEQQRALAMLHEREHLARELHDSLGQVLSFASLKIGATRKLLADGKLAKVDDHLAHLESIVTEAHADVRENILNLHTAPTKEKPFFATLQHYLDGFHQNYGIQVEVFIGKGVDEGGFEPQVQMELFHILQEALSNARKHAQASCVNLSFEIVDSLVRIRIRDNGQGIDPQLAVKQGGDHFGLRFMHERAEQMGGALRVESEPGQGTCVEVEAPMNSGQETVPHLQFTVHNSLEAS